jgi:hypothetical protein
VGCGYFYDSDPTTADANGFVLCGRFFLFLINKFLAGPVLHSHFCGTVSKNQHLAHSDIKDMKHRGLIKHMHKLAQPDHTGIRYVEAGPKIGNPNLFTT